MTYIKPKFYKTNPIIIFINQNFIFLFLFFKIHIYKLLKTNSIFHFISIFFTLN